MQGKTKADWLESLLHKKENKTHPNRSEEQSALLNEAARAMETHQVRLQIPQRYIRIMHYLADNPRAVLIADRNVTMAFRYAKEAMAK